MKLALAQKIVEVLVKQVLFDFVEDFPMSVATHHQVDNVNEQDSSSYHYS